MEGGQGSREGFSLEGVLPPGCTSMAGTRGQDDGPPHGPPQQTPTLRGKPGPLGSRLPGPRWEPSSGQCKRQNRVGGGPGLLGTSSQGTLGPGATSLDGGGAGAWLPGGGPTLGVWARGVAGSDHWEHHPLLCWECDPAGLGCLQSETLGQGRGGAARGGLEAAPAGVLPLRQPAPPPCIHLTLRSGQAGGLCSQEGQTHAGVCLWASGAAKPVCACVPLSRDHVTEEVEVLAGVLGGRERSLGPLGHQKHRLPVAFPRPWGDAASRVLRGLTRLWLQAPLPRWNPASRALRGGLNGHVLPQSSVNREVWLAAPLAISFSQVPSAQPAAAACLLESCHTL